MAGSVNKVILIGNLGRDPEVRHFEEGRSNASFSLATSETFTGKTGERQERTEWHNISIWRPGLVKVVDQFLKKGNKVYVEGQLSTRKWKDESTGQDKYSTEIVLQGYNSSLTMLDSRNSPGNNSNLVSENKSSLPNENLNQENSDLDDEIPF